MKTPRTSSSRAAACLLLAAACGTLGSPALAARRRVQQLVPATFVNKVDALGFNWDINHQTGQVNRGTNYCFNGAQVLQVNGRNFSSNQPKMTADGSEYVLTSTSVPGLEVTRRIRLDAKAGAVRYVDSFKNTGASAVNVSVTLRTQMGSQCQAVVSDLGTPNPTSLGKKGCGIFVIQRPQYNRPSLLLYLASARSKLKPTISNQNNYTFQSMYNLTVPPRKSVSVLHGIAQRRTNTTPDPKTLAGLFKPFKSRKWLSGLPADVRRTIVNARGLGFGAGGAARELVGLEQLDVARGNQDVLALGEETRLTGTATCARLVVRSGYGEATVPFEKVAALVGAKSRSGGPRVHLRDGQVFGGTIETEGFRFTMSSGLTMDLRMEALDRLVTSAAASDGDPGEKVSAWIETVDGDRLSLVRSGRTAGLEDPPVSSRFAERVRSDNERGDPNIRLSAATPWGQRDIRLADLRSLRSAASPSLGHRVALKDGSRFLAFLDNRAVELDTLLFGTRKFEPAQIRAIVARGNGASEEDDAEDIDSPHLVLVGENMLAGRIDLAEVRFVTFGEVIPVPPEQMRSLRNVSDEDGTRFGGGQTFSADVWAGGTVVGRIMEVVLPVRVGDEVWQVPTRDIVDVIVPSPTVPDALRGKIARLIRDLGHPDWETREAATGELKELGYLARTQLAEALRAATDPEVRRRAQDLLDGLTD